MLGHLGFVHGAGIVVKPARDGEVNGEVFLRHAEVREISRDGFQLVQADIKGLVHAAIALQRGDNFLVRTLYSHEVEHVLRLAGQHLHLVDEKLFDLLGAYLVELIDGAHDVARALRHAVHGIEAVEYLAVIDLYFELRDAELCEGAVYDGGDLRLVYDVKLAVADNVDIRLIKLAEAASLCPLTAVDLAYLVAAERKGQLAVMAGNVLCKRHREVEAQRKVAVALGEAVYLLFGLAAALCKQDLRRLDYRGVERREAVDGIAFSERRHHALHLHLLRRQQLHKPGKCTR